MDIASIAGTLMRMGAPVLGGALGGPAGAAVATTIIGALASAFGTDPTPEAVGAALEKSDAAIVVQRVEKAEAPAVVEAVNQYIQDVQDARRQTVQLVEAGSSIAWGAPVVSVIVMIAFCILSYLAIANTQATNRDVVLYLLGAWQGLATVVVGYWVGSSASSKAKDATIATMTADAAIATTTAVKAVVKGRR